MADNLHSEDPRDQSRVNLHVASELRYWSEKFGVEPKRLRQAIIIVGPLVKDVELFLSKVRP
jgi:hypothetical protein